MQQTNCLNCGYKYCPQCGQTTDTHKLSLSHIWHDLLHAVTHADKSIFSLIRHLLFNPGKVAAEYVEGKRKKYFNPFAFLVLVVGIASLILISSGFTNFAGNPRMQGNPVSAFFNKHINLIIFLNVPLLGMFSSLFFRKSGRNFAENLVLAAYTSGERSVFFSIVIAAHTVLPVSFHLYFQLAYLLCLGLQLFSYWQENGEFLQGVYDSPLYAVVNDAAGFTDVYGIFLFLLQTGIKKAARMSCFLLSKEVD
jgi:hypothetical protein